MKISQTYNGKTHSAFVRHTIDASANDDDPAVALARVFDKVEADIAEIRAARAAIGRPVTASVDDAAVPALVAQILRAVTDLARAGVRAELSFADSGRALGVLRDLGIPVEVDERDGYDYSKARSEIEVAGDSAHTSVVSATSFRWLDTREAIARRAAERAKRNVVTAAFVLTMPSNNAWNGRWSGDGKNYEVTRELALDVADRILGEPGADPVSWSHDFGDGWRAQVTGRRIDDCATLKQSEGFAGFDWMVDSIIEHGSIRTSTPGKAVPASLESSPAGTEPGPDEAPL